MIMFLGLLAGKLNNKCAHVKLDSLCFVCFAASFGTASATLGDDSNAMGIGVLAAASTSFAHANFSAGGRGAELHEASECSHHTEQQKAEEEPEAVQLQFVRLCKDALHTHHAHYFDVLKKWNTSTTILKAPGLAKTECDLAKAILAGTVKSAMYYSVHEQIFETGKFYIVRYIEAGKLSGVVKKTIKSVIENKIRSNIELSKILLLPLIDTDTPSTIALSRHQEWNNRNVKESKLIESIKKSMKESRSKSVVSACVLLPDDNTTDVRDLVGVNEYRNHVYDFCGRDKDSREYKSNCLVLGIIDMQFLVRHLENNAQTTSQGQCLSDLVCKPNLTLSSDLDKFLVMRDANQKIPLQIQFIILSAIPACTQDQLEFWKLVHARSQSPKRYKPINKLPRVSAQDVLLHEEASVQHHTRVNTRLARAINQLILGTYNQRGEKRPGPAVGNEDNNGQFRPLCFGKQSTTCTPILTLVHGTGSGQKSQVSQSTCEFVNKCQTRTA